MTTRYISGAALETTEPDHDFPYPTARTFQNTALNWIQDDSSVGVMTAPTGGGKTAVFPELIKNSRKTLVVYPTNALLRQQKQTLAESGVSAKVVNADTLTNHGTKRTEELIQYSQSRQFDAIITNPDILQAILQDMYVHTGQANTFFNGFDAVIYDEFHFYDTFAASGLLLQIKVLTERQHTPKILLASATPDDSFVEFLETELGLETTRIDANYTEPENGSQFRYPLQFTRHSEYIGDCFDSILETLSEKISEYDSTSPRIAVIFNSAATSNRFHSYASSEYPSVYGEMVKDNGYDTNADTDTETDGLILNTTSKGEVGLDYNITDLYMALPYDASAFIQRVGRAGRQAPAEVHVYGCKQLNWGDELSFEEFVESAWDTFQSVTMSSDAIRDLMGLRAAHAVWSREESGRINTEVYADFTDIPNYGAWKRFIELVHEEHGKERGMFDPQLNQALENLLAIMVESFDGVQTLRGESLSARIQYPRGNQQVETVYSVLSSVNQYGVKQVRDDGVVVLGGEQTEQVAVRYVGLSNVYEYSAELESELADGIRSLVSGGNFADTELDSGMFHRFVNHVPIRSVLTPDSVTAGPISIPVE